MATLDSYLFFQGQCEAMRFHERTLGGRLEGRVGGGVQPT